MPAPTQTASQAAGTTGLGKAFTTKHLERSKGETARQELLNLRSSMSSVGKQFPRSQPRPRALLVEARLGEPAVGPGGPR